MRGPIVVVMVEVKQGSVVAAAFGRVVRRRLHRKPAAHPSGVGATGGVGAIPCGMKTKEREGERARTCEIQRDARAIPFGIERERG